MELFPFCSSPRCVGDHQHTSKGVLKNNVRSHALSCPDCGYVLLWTKLRKNGTPRYKTVAEYNKQSKSAKSFY